LRVHPYRFSERLLGASKVVLNEGGAGDGQLCFRKIGLGEQILLVLAHGRLQLRLVNLAKIGCP